MRIRTPLILIVILLAGIVLAQTLSVGEIEYYAVGMYDIVLETPTAWHWCDADGDGSEGADVTGGTQMNNNEVLTILGNQYACFQNGIYETIAECCGDDVCNSAGSGGERYSTGERVGGRWTCQSDGTWVVASSPEDDIILKLSSTENAHAESYSGTSYATEIKYSTIFGTTFVGNPHPTCETITMIKLSDSTNAHAEMVGGAGGYGTDICYGGIGCEYVTGGGDCTIGECIATISGDTNAHVSTCNAVTTYATKVCCGGSVGICPSGQDYCPGTTQDPANPDCCFPGYTCSFGECIETQAQCYASNTVGNYACFTDLLETHPYDCLGGGVAPGFDRACCEGCMQGWDYNCWTVVDVY